jgi:hypothetical protein
VATFSVLYKQLEKNVNYKESSIGVSWSLSCNTTQKFNFAFCENLSLYLMVKENKNLCIPHRKRNRVLYVKPGINV